LRFILNKKSVSGLFLFGLGSAFRHEGIITAIIVAFLFLVINSKAIKVTKSRIIFLIQILLVAFILIVSAVFQNLLVNVTNAQPAPKDNSLSSFIHDLAFTRVTSPLKLPRDVDLIVGSIVSGESAQAASQCTLGSVMFQKSGFDSLALTENASKVPVLWLKVLFSENGLNLLKARYCKAQTFIPFPLATPPPFYVWGYIGIDPNPLGLKSAIPDGFFKPIVIGMKNIVSSWLSVWNDFGRVRAWPGLHTSFILIILTLFRSKLQINQNTEIILLSIVTGRTLVLIAATNGPWYRLALPMYLISISLALVVVHRVCSLLKKEFNKL
jgi:hypothetical protein